MTRKREDDEESDPFGEEEGSSELPAKGKSLPGKGKKDPRFPFGETSSDAANLESDSDAADLLGSDASGLGNLLESDDPSMNANSQSDSGADFIVKRTPRARPDANKLSTGSRHRLPADPPGSRPEDDASLDGLESDQGATDSSDEVLEELSGPSDQGPIPTASLTERLGQVGPSGPLVIVDDDAPEDSVRYQASVVDDDARVAGSAGSVRKKKRKTGERPADWSAEDEPDPDAAVPTLSARRSARRSGEHQPPPPAKRGGLLVALLALLIGGAIAGVGQELRWRKLEQERAQAAADQLASELEAARQKSEADLAAAQKAGRDASDAAAQRADAAEAGKRKAEADAAKREEQARAAARAEAEAQVKEAQEARARAEQAIEVQLADTRRQVEEAAQKALEQAVAEEKARGDAALQELARTEEQKRREELDALKKQLEQELAGAPTRAEEKGLAEDLAESRKEDLDQVAPSGGGGSGGDDWDDVFSDAPSSGGTGSGEADPFADDAAGGGGMIDRFWEWARKNIHGFVAYKNLSHFSRGEFHDLRKTRHEFRARLSFADWLMKTDDGLTGLRLVASLDFRVDDDEFAKGWPEGVDDEETNRPHVWPEELYLGAVHDWLEVRAGWQRFAWGTGDLLNPTDNLNPLDFSDLFDARRISVLSLSTRVQLDPFALELVSIPTFTRTRLPLPGTRFDLLRGSPIVVLRPDDPAGTADNMQWGARAVVRKFGWDVSISGFTGWEDIPSATLSTISVFPPIFQAATQFDRMHVLGADFATTLGFLGLDGKPGDILGGIQLHGEAAYFHHEGETLDDYVQFVFGFNYQFVDLILEHDLTLIVEYAGDYETHQAEQPFPGVNLGRIFRGGFLARLQYQVDEELSFELNGGIITHGRENGLIHPGVIWSPTDWVSFELAGDVFFGPEETFFGRFKRDGRVLTTIKLTF